MTAPAVPSAPSASTASRAVPRPSWAAWTVLSAAALFVAGAVAVPGIVLIGLARRALRPGRLLMGLAVGALALVPLAMLFHGLPGATALSPRIVRDNFAAHGLAFTAIFLFVVGAALDVPRARRVGSTVEDLLEGTAMALGSSDDPSHVVRGSVWIVLSVAVQAVTNVGFWLAAAALYTPTAVGHASELFAALLFINYLTGMGLAVTISRFSAAPGPEGQVLFSWAVAATAVTSVIGSLGYVALVPSVGASLVSTPGNLALFIASVAGAAVAVLVDIRLVTARRWGLVVLRSAAVGATRVPLLLFHVDHTSAVWVFSAGSLPTIASAAVGLAVLRALRIQRYRWLPLPANRGAMVRFALVNWGANLASQAPLLAMPVIVALRVSTVDNANFYAAWSAATLVVIAPSMIFQVLLSESSRQTVLGRRVRLREGLTAAIGLSLLAVVGSWLARPIVVVAYGAAYRPASELLPVLAAAGIPWSITAALLTDARHRHDHAATISITLGVGLGTLGLATPLISSGGIDGAARAWLLGNTIGAACALLANRVWWRRRPARRHARSRKWGHRERSRSGAHAARRATSAR